MFTEEKNPHTAATDPAMDPRIRTLLKQFAQIKEKAGLGRGGGGAGGDDSKLKPEQQAKLTHEEIRLKLIAGADAWNMLQILRFGDGSDVEGVSVESVEIDGIDGNRVGCEIYTPSGGREPILTIVNFRGGGMAIGV